MNSGNGFGSKLFTGEAFSPYCFVGFVWTNLAVNRQNGSAQDVMMEK
jgi:hypothetical protein